MGPTTSSSVVSPHGFRSFCFRGEGRANFVISAKSRKTGVRIAWRLAKHRKSNTVSIKPKCRVIIAYMENLIVPFLGREFLVKPKVVDIDVLYLHHLSKIPSLPLNLKVETFDELCDTDKYPVSMSFFPSCCSKGVRFVSVLQMMDATRIPKHISAQYLGLTITVEIKPKQGFMQEHPGIDVPYCNNCILQLEKCHSDAYDRMYDFCPLDLFSGRLERMRRAINSLIAVPHRNLRIFLDGTLIYSDELQLSSGELQEILFRNGSVTLEQLVTALCCIMTGSPSDESFEMRNSSVLAKLLEGQRVDTIGIVRAYEIYSGLPPEIQKELLNKRLLLRNGLSFLEQTSDRAVVERYLLAATMKDCSVMICVRLLDPVAFAAQNISAYGQQVLQVVSSKSEADMNLSDNSRNAYFAYSVKIVDLDPKTPKNLLNSYERFMNGVRLLQEKPNIRRPCIT